MAEISTALILDGITLALHAAFPSSKVHVEKVRQNLAEGDLYVKLVSSGNKNGICKRVNRYPSFDISYFGEDVDANIQAMDVLMEVLQLITLPTGDKVHGVNINANIVDEVLHMTVNYDYRAYKQEKKAENMTALEVGING